MDCLKDYIGLAGCGGDTPASGLFINSLPGISLKSIDSLADTDQVNYIGVWNDVQTRAIKRLELMIISEMSKNVALKSVKFQTSTHNPNTQTVVPVSGMYILFKANCYSAFQYHYINEICVDDPYQALAYNVQFFDYDTMEIIDSVNGFPIAGECATLPINKKFYRRNVLMRFSKQSYFYSSPMLPIKSDCASIEFGQWLTDNNNLVSTDNSYGVNIKGYAIGCDANNLACDNKSLFAFPLWYLCGSELMMERIGSNRINFWTMDRKQAEELKAFFDVEVEKYIKMAMNGVSFADCDCCTKCDPLVAIREARL